jgi:hypothetical protein
MPDLQKYQVPDIFLETIKELDIKGKKIRKINTLITFVKLLAFGHYYFCAILLVQKRAKKYQKSAPDGRIGTIKLCRSHLALYNKRSKIKPFSIPVKLGRE